MNVNAINNDTDPYDIDPSDPRSPWYDPTLAEKRAHPVQTPIVTENVSIDDTQDDYTIDSVSDKDVRGEAAVDEDHAQSKRRGLRRLNNRI